MAAKGMERTNGQPRPATARAVKRAPDTANALGHEGTTRDDSSAAPHVDLSTSILYLCALIAAQPRAIDRHIDYFGESVAVGARAPARTLRRRVRRPA